MPMLSEVLGAYVERRTDEAAGLSPLTGTDAAIRRKRAVRQGATAGASVLGVGVLFASGTVAARHYASIQPAAYYLPEGGGTVTIAVDGPNPTLPDVGIECGDPAPVAIPTADGFSVEAEDAPDSEFYEEYGYLDGTVTVTNNNVEQFRAYALAPTVVVVQDGVVVALENGYPNDRLSFTPGRKAMTQAFTVARWTDCGDGENDRLPDGDYEYYVVTTVANSPEIAAVSRAIGPYGASPWFNGDLWLEPTDWECVTTPDDSPFYGWGSDSAACLPQWNSEFTWDAQSRTVTMPYADGQVTRVFSATMVSGPFAYTAKPEAWLEDFPASEESFAVDDPTAPCGAELERGERGDETHFIATAMTAERISQAGQLDADVWVQFGPDGLPSRTATLATSADSPALVVVSRIVEGDGYVIDTQVVVGKATVTVNRGNDIHVGRATGPESVSVAFDDVQWCDGTVPDEPIWVYVAAPLTIVGGDVQHDATWFQIYDYGGE